MSNVKLIDQQDTETTQCNQCQEPFEVDVDLDHNDVPSTFVDIAVECDQGNFCSEACRARAMYEAQDEGGKKALRRYYLGASLISDNHHDVQRITREWDVETILNDVEVDAEINTLSPDGGSRGVPGPEDDCEAYLMDVTTRKIIWDGLYMGQRAAIGEVVRAEMQAEQFKTQYWQDEVVAAKERLAKAEAALKTLEVIGKVV